MPLDRPPRASIGAVTERVRRAILGAAGRADLSCSDLLERHARAEQLAGASDVIDDVEERYGLDPGSLLSAPDAQRCLARIAAGHGLLASGTRRELYAECVLNALPDTEFLAVIESAAAGGAAAPAADLVKAADDVLKAHGCAFRREPRSRRHFVWVGDPKQHELVVEPALQALADQRLTGARAEFEEALRRRKVGTPKSLEDAVDEAAKAVESTLQILHGVARTGKEAVSQLFKSLKDAQILPQYVSNLVMAAAGPRNNMASHGQGATVREVPEELAEASIAAAATAITFLAHYLP